ncbi:hypothetical protein [uncultured Friedmanniella sp.]|uniref:hypothetical protein n=1 Tax=uncultured Friedmanniella sp. TaxID=335381 RepID=UPI0035CB3E27
MRPRSASLSHTYDPATSTHTITVAIVDSHHASDTVNAIWQKISDELLPPSLRSVGLEPTTTEPDIQTPDPEPTTPDPLPTRTDPHPAPTSPPISLPAPMRETTHRVGFRTNGRGYWRTDL